MYDVYAKNSEDAGRINEISEKFSSNDIKLKDITDLFKVAYGKKEAAELISPFYNKAQALGNFNYSLPLS